MGTQDRIGSAIDDCYEAILAPDLWPGALHNLARSLDAACAMFYPRNPDTGSHDPKNPNRSIMAMPISPDFHDLLAVYLRDGWYLNHYRAERGLPLIDSGRRVVVEHELATEEERRHLAHYHEFYLRFGFPGFAMIGFKVDGNPWIMPLLKGQGQGHFESEDVRRLEALAPHFRRMVNISERFVTSQSAAGLGLLDATNAAAVLLDWRGRVARMNARAEALLGTDLRVVAGRLAAADTTSQRNLQKFVAEAVAAESPRGFRSAPIAIARQGRRPLIVDAMPTTGLIADAFGLTRAILIVTDLEERANTPEDRIRATLGLTPAEARLASRLAGGEDLGSAAEAIGITRETARSQLKAIFAKTRTGRQAELVALVSRIGWGPVPGIGRP